ALRATALPLEDQYAAAELFRGNMMRHSAIAYCNDNAAIPEIRFDDDDWLEYIPLRGPDAVTVRERLPPGVAAILINRAHSHTDIFLPIHPREMRVLEAIDGQRTIREMLANETDPVAARSLFKRLWWHDQVVFAAAPQR